jgi:hypothetical protein
LPDGRESILRLPSHRSLDRPNEPFGKILPLITEKLRLPPRMLREEVVPSSGFDGKLSRD